jgi:hypothetical protein
MLTTVASQLARLMLMYPIAYILIWTLPTAIRIYQASTGKPAPFALQTVDKVLPDSFFGYDDPILHVQP